MIRFWTNLLNASQNHENNLNKNQRYLIINPNKQPNEHEDQRRQTAGR